MPTEYVFLYCGKGIHHSVFYSLRFIHLSLITSESHKTYLTEKHSDH